VIGKRKQIRCSPGETCGGVFDDVSGVVEGVECACFAEGGDGLTGGFEAAGGLALAEEFGDYEQPEMGESLVVAGGGGVGSADGQVEGADADAQLGQDGGEIGIEEVEGSGGNVGAVGPLGFVQSAGFEAVQKAFEGFEGGEVFWAHFASLDGICFRIGVLNEIGG